MEHGFKSHFKMLRGEARIKDYQIVEQHISVKGLGRQATRSYLAG